MPYTYLRRPDELLIDLDNKPGETSKTEGALSRLNGAHLAGALDVVDARLYPSGGEWHHHMVIKLAAPLSLLHALAWSQRLCDDPFRCALSGLRVGTATCQPGAESLLITPDPWPDFWRDPDFVCECKGKHSTRSVSAACPVLSRLRPGESVDALIGVPKFPDARLHFGKLNLDERG